MAKPIYVTEADVDSICHELKQSLRSLRCYGSLDIKRSFKSDDRVAVLYFTQTAWIKMTALVSRFETEVQWHGMVRRISENEFEIYDIIVPPHEVSGATVTSEYRPYIEWMDGLDDDTFNAVRFHGHSHVNMSVSPSAVDDKYRLDLVTQLPKPAEGEDVFYVFLIINKRHEWSAEIYDLTNNALYDTKEIYIECPVGESNVDSFVLSARKVAVARRTTYQYGGYGGYGAGAGVYGSGTGNYGSCGFSSTPKEVTGSVSKTNGAKGKKSTNHFGYSSLKEYYDSVYGEGWDDDDGLGCDNYRVLGNDDKDTDDPNDPFYVKEY